MTRWISPHLEKESWSRLLQKEDLAIDATCGRGQDTLFLSRLCKVISLDIQEEALREAKKRIEKDGLSKEVSFHLLCHSEIESLDLQKKPLLIVYNLGYLPRANKTLTTKVETTKKSVEGALKCLAPGGVISITCYPGHEEGAKEEAMLFTMLETLDSNLWLVSYERWINRPRFPSTFLISSRR